MKMVVALISSILPLVSSLDLKAQLDSPDWVVVMSQDSSISEQVHFVSGPGFPYDKIKEYTSKGFVIDQFSGRGGKSFLVLTKYKHYSPKQDYKIFSGKPDSWVIDRRKDGYRLIIYSPLWFNNKTQTLVVMNKEDVKGWFSQTKEWPERHLTEGTICPERVFHSWQVTNGEYYYVWNDVRTPFIVGERSYFPNEYLEDQKKEGLMIKHLSLRFLNGEKGGWGFILVRNTSWSDQVYYYNPGKIGNPQTWITSNMDNGYFITSIF